MLQVELRLLIVTYNREINMDNAGGSNVITKFSEGKEGGKRHQTSGSVRKAELDTAGSEGL